MRKLILLFLVLLLPVLVIQAQDNVWVTTQDNVSLRLGPGQHWERVAVVPSATTTRAVGRTVNSDWIQLAYEAPLEPDASDEATIDGVTYGWMSADYLVWSGNVLVLPVDGIPTIATSRRTGPLLVIGSGTLFFEILGDFDNPVQNLIIEPTQVEVTGRIGSTANTYFWLQFELNGNFYWTPTWETGVPGGVTAVLDASYLYPFGRVYNALVSDANTASATLYVIRGRWQDLDGGFATTCNDIPVQIVLDERLTSSNDLRYEPILQAPLNVLEEAVNNINVAVANFENVCTQPLEGRTASAEIIAESLSVLNQASEEINFLAILFTPIAELNPIVRN